MDPNLLVGIETADDAAVYRLTDDIAVISTVDFITPPVDDPYWFGQIAAANSISDVYSMGGRPLTALNLVMFPAKRLDAGVLKDILRGGHDKVVEAGASLVGGHSVDDEEPKYGLCVNGLVHPDRIITNAGARPGDALILTKPIGSPRKLRDPGEPVEHRRRAAVRPADLWRAPPFGAGLAGRGTRACAGVSRCHPDSENR